MLRRFKLVNEIYEHADIIAANKATIIMLLATMTDKELTKFHAEFIKKT